MLALRLLHLVSNLIGRYFLHHVLDEVAALHMLLELLVDWISGLYPAKQLLLILGVVLALLFELCRKRVPSLVHRCLFRRHLLL